MWIIEWLTERFAALVNYLDDWHVWARIIFVDYIWGIRRYVVYWQNQVNKLVNDYWNMVESFFGNRWGAFWQICVTNYNRLVWYAESVQYRAEKFFSTWYNIATEYFDAWYVKLWYIPNRWFNNLQSFVENRWGAFWHICVTLYTTLVWYAETAYGAALSYFGGWYNYLRTYVVDWFGYVSILTGNYWNQINSFFGNRWGAFWQVCITWYGQIQALVTVWYDRLAQLSGHMFDRLALLSFDWFDRLMDLLQNRYAALLLLLQNPTGVIWDSLQENLWDWLEWWLAYLIDGNPTQPPNRR